MYDFNLEVGDEVYVVNPLYPFSWDNDNRCEFSEPEMNCYKCKITEIDEIEYNQVKRKRLKVADLYDLEHDFWIEGIGNMKGITHQITFGTGFHQLKECYISDKLIFVNENPEYCWIF
jgi:hypothetical protein